MKPVKITFKKESNQTELYRLEQTFEEEGSLLCSEKKDNKLVFTIDFDKSPFLKSMKNHNIMKSVVS